MNASHPVGQHPSPAAERHRGASPESARLHESEVSDHDRELFGHLLDEASWQPPGPQMPERFATATSESPSSTASPPEWEPLQQKLVELLPERAERSGQELEASLMMPNLGEVRLALKSMPGNGWGITLRFARRETLEKLRDGREHCRRDLADALGRPIRLEFEQRADWA